MDGSKEWRPVLRRLFVFWIPEQPKVKVSENAFLYLPKANRGKLTSCQPMWILSCAKDCKLGPNEGMWPRGLKAFVHDGLEISECDLDLWDQYKDQAEFYDLKSEAESVDAKVVTAIVSEGSIIATAESVWSEEAKQVRSNQRGNKIGI